MKQWHPLFAKLLRPVLEQYYEILTNLPVGDLPREADIVLLRRTGSAAPPFHGLWKFLTQWNVLEFKGPSVSPRVGDLDMLVELGLGITRRLNEARQREGSARVRSQDICFWYLVNRLGSRFLRSARRLMDGLDAIGAGIWRCQLMGHLIFLVSAAETPVDAESLPLHLLQEGSPATVSTIARLVFSHTELMNKYRDWVVSLHPAVIEEFGTMARTKELEINLEPFVELLGMKEVVRKLGLERVIREVGEKEVIEKLGMDRIIAALSPAQRRLFKKRLQRE